MMGALLGGALGGLFKGGGRAFGPSPIMGLAGSLTGQGGQRKRRRRRARLTKSALLELTTIKTTLGKTAAAEALPFYLGR